MSMNQRLDELKKKGEKAKIRKISSQDVRAKIQQDNGHGTQDRSPSHRTERLWRRQDTGGGCQPRRLRRNILSKRSRLGRDSTDLSDNGSVRRRSGLLARDDRLHFHGRQD